jgi:hypothetical protein
MKPTRAVGLVIMILGVGIIAGCVGNRDVIKAMSAGSRHDVFQEIPEGALPVPGYADIRIYSSLKTHEPGLYSEEDIHGTARYALLVGIDGQVGEFRGFAGREGSMDCMDGPEEGKGVRYTFTKNLRIKAGVHRISVAIPYDDIVMERKINLVEKTTNTLILQPDYRRIPWRAPGYLHKTSFKEGIRSLRMELNGQEM